MAVDANNQVAKPEEVIATPDQKKAVAPNEAPATHDVEIEAGDAPEKTYFNKASVWLMILFSGLAIGSDG